MPSMRNKLKAPAGFTLVEMLLVILVIAVLAGMILYSAGKAGQSNAKADTVAKIEKVRAALEEFYAEYGQYPPVRSDLYGGAQPFSYEYPSSNTDASGVASIIGGNSDWSKGPIFTFGLMSYLARRWDRVSWAVNSPLITGNTQWDSNNDIRSDQPRDIKAMKRWAPFLDGITWSSWVARNYGLNQVGYAYTNLYITVLDGWSQELHYHSDPPYQSYDVWSSGPDGKDGGWLGGVTNSTTAADDIHSGAGH